MDYRCRQLKSENRIRMECGKSCLDMGYSYIGEGTAAVENAGKAVVRRTSYTTEDGRAVLQDTNNSSVDFKASVRATLLPAQ